MSQNKLGKGLTDLGLNELLGDFDQTAAAADTVAYNDMQHLTTEQLSPGQFQPRQHFDEDALTELADSIQSQGIIQPIVVRPLNDDRYEIIAGERRWRAAKMLGLHEVPALIRQLTDEDAVALALIENIQRRDLNVLEEAQALQRLLSEFQMTHQEIANAVGKSRTAISNLLRLLNLTPEVKELLAAGQLDMGHARALLALDPQQQTDTAHEIIANQLTVRDAETLSQQKNAVNPAANSKRSRNTQNIDPEIDALQQQFSKILNTKVTIKHRASGKGQMVIHYEHWTDLRQLLAQLQYE